VSRLKGALQTVQWKRPVVRFNTCAETGGGAGGVNCTATEAGGALLLPKTAAGIFVEVKVLPGVLF
jgi:hypothetical protein